MVYTRRFAPLLRSWDAGSAQFAAVVPLITHTMCFFVSSSVNGRYLYLYVFEWRNATSCKTTDRNRDALRS